MDVEVITGQHVQRGNQGQSGKRLGTVHIDAYDREWRGALDCSLDERTLTYRTRRLKSILARLIHHVFVARADTRM